MQISGGSNIRYCSGSPDISTEIDVNNSDRCYLYRAVGQGETRKAIQWLSLWKDISLTLGYKLCDLEMYHTQK
jgi:hypothetical protein